MDKFKNSLENYLRKARSTLELQYNSLPPRDEFLDKAVGREIRPRKSLDISASQLAYAIKECATSRESERTETERLLVQAFYKNASERAGQSPLTFGLCVRTIYEATLKALNLPRETVVLMSAITIQDMVVITEALGAKVVAVDINPDSLVPDARELDRLCTHFAGRTKVFVLAHLFGARTNVTQLIEVCRRHNVLFIEDCAEAWAGPGVFLGNDASDVSLFSFGTIKTATALGGAIGRFRSLQLMNKVSDIMNTYPVRPVSVDATRFAKYAMLNQVTKNDRVFGAAVSGMRMLSLDHDQVIRTFSRGFARDQDLFAQMRFRPTVPTLKLLLKRMHEFDFNQAQERRFAGKALSAELRDALGLDNIVVPGALDALEDHEYWLFPVSIIDEGVDLMKVQGRMLADGFDVTGGTTQLASLDMVVSDPLDPDFSTPLCSRTLMSRILYLPLGDGCGGASMRKRLMRSLGRAIGIFEDDDDDDNSDQGNDPAENEGDWVDSDDEQEHSILDRTAAKL